jgi:uncharacterized protein YndB with AHSA1/START domain
MSKTLVIAPVTKIIAVKAPQARAFETFTAGLDRWWPKGHGIGATPVKRSIIEPHVGGRWHTLHEDGSDVTVGVMKVWDAPSRIVFSWDVNAQWKPDPSVGSEVEVRFIAEGPNATRIELEHRKFEALGAEGGAKLRGDVNGGWPGLLERFKVEAEAPA